MSSDAQAPSGWSVHTERRKIGGVERQETYFVTRTGKKIRTMNEVHYHLKNELSPSSMTADEALWLRTLERYGQNCRHWAIARSAHDLPECPTFRPTAEEFREPGAYLEALLPTIEEYGMCKVVPPAG